MEDQLGAQQASEKEGIELPCAEPGCTKSVVYTRKPRSGIAFTKRSERRTVYLECPDGHLRRYRIGF